MSETHGELPGNYRATTGIGPKLQGNDRATTGHCRARHLFGTILIKENKKSKNAITTANKKYLINVNIDKSNKTIINKT